MITSWTAGRGQLRVGEVAARRQGKGSWCNNRSVGFVLIGVQAIEDLTWVGTPIKY